MQLNKSQMSAVSLRDGPALILAGPGSGKTAVITKRVHALIKSGVPPEDILVITFTRAAAGEMRRRFEKLCHGPLPPVTFGTFHSIFFNILCHEANLTKNNIISDSERYRITKDILQKTSKKDDDESDFITTVLDEISSVKAEGGLSKGYRSRIMGTADFVMLYKSYQRELARLRLIDFDDMLILTKKIFLTRPDALKRWRKRYKYIMVDEFQDVNKVQYEVLCLLAHPLNNIFVVGDDDQSIYGFRGSTPQIMLRFPDDYKNARVITLNVNYRSSKEIVDTASRVICQNKNRYSKNLKANFGSYLPPTIKEFETVKDENIYIIEQINRLHNEGVSYGDMAALYRTNRTYRSLAEALSKSNIPFGTESKLINIYEHWVALDIFAYLRLALKSYDRADFIRIVNRPCRYIKRDVFEDERVDLAKIIRASANNRSVYMNLKKLSSDLAYLSRLSPYAAISFVRRGIGYDRYLKEYANGRSIDIAELMMVADELLESSRGYKSISDWFTAVNEFKNFMRESPPRNVDAVSLSTMHKSKGLEYEAVFIPDAIDGLTPYHKAKMNDEIEEERRLFYVALTRAKRHLYVLYPKNRYNRKTIPSRFILEMKPDFYSSPSSSANSISSKISSKRSATTSYSSSVSI